MGRDMTRRTALATAGLGGLGALLAGCSTGTTGDQSMSSSSAARASSSSAAPATDDVVVRVASLKGPTTIGLVEMMDATSGIPADGGDISAVGVPEEGGVTYEWQVSSSPDEVLPLVVAGTADIACVPSNAAAVLYNRTDGGVQVIDLNTLGVLSVVTGDASIEEFEDLAGRTVLISGKGSSPEYVMGYLLGEAGIADSVALEWKSEHTEVAAALAADPTAVGVLPQPFTTATLAQNPSLSSPVALADVWDRYAGASGSRFVMGATVVRRAFAEEHPAAVADFLERHAASVKAVNDDPAAAAPLVVEAGIVASEAVAEQAIPACNVVCITGDEAREALDGYLQVLYDADASSVGGELPGDDLYWQA